MCPYIFSLLLKFSKRVFGALFSKGLAILVFRVIDFININTLRMITYIFAFFLCIVIYSYQISNPANILYLIKDPLLTYIVLDTILFGVYSGVINSKKRKLKIRYKDDLYYYEEYLRVIRDAIVFYNIINNDGKACIKGMDITVPNKIKDTELILIYNRIFTLGNKKLSYFEIYSEINLFLREKNRFINQL